MCSDCASYFSYGIIAGAVLSSIGTLLYVLIHR